MRFSFGVNVYVFIPMVLFFIDFFFNQNRYTWEWVEFFFAWDFMGLAQTEAKHTTIQVLTFNVFFQI